MNRTRAELATAVRPFAPGGRLLPAHIPAFDVLADVLGLPADAAAPAAPAAQVGLSPADFASEAARLSCSVAQIRAVWEVESGGGYFSDVRAAILDLDGPGGFIDGPNLPKILFEAHVFDRQTGGRFSAVAPNLSSPRWNRALYVGGVAEWERLYRAMALDRTAALMSASAGGPQIMGFNYALAGFDTVEAFWSAMKRSERDQLAAFGSFILNSKLGPALRKISNVHADCVPFASGYNGTGYAANEYHVKIARAHAKWTS